MIVLVSCQTGIHVSFFFRYCLKHRRIEDTRHNETFSEGARESTGSPMWIPGTETTGPGVTAQSPGGSGLDSVSGKASDVCSLLTERQMTFLPSSLKCFPQPPAPYSLKPKTVMLSPQIPKAMFSLSRFRSPVHPGLTNRGKPGRTVENRGRRGKPACLAGRFKMFNRTGANRDKCQKP